MKNHRNYAHSSNIQLTTRLFENEDTTYYIQGVNLPGINNGNIQLSTQFGQLQVVGDVSEYETLTLSIIMDEELDVYQTIIKYCQNIHQPGTLINAIPEHKDITLTLLNNNNKVLFRIKFYNCYLESISGINYTFNTPNSELTTELLIKYNYFEILDKNTY